jgi:hypothetical protein
MPITSATTRMTLSSLPGRWGVRFASVAAVTGLVSSCGSWGGSEESARRYPLDIGARSASGMVCGVLDRERVAALTRVPAELQHEDSLFRTYPSAGLEFRAIECTVLDESDPQRALLGVVVTQDIDEEEVLRRRRAIDPRAGAVRFPRAWGDGAAAPQVGGYVIRRCPNKNKYLLHTGTLEKFGTAQQWLDIMGNVIKRADAAGACVPRPLIDGSPSSKSSTR